jgi:hypothetical protein
MLGRRSTLIGAMVQAANIATHNSIESVYIENKQSAGTNDSKEVVLATERSKTLQTSELIE